VQISFFFFLLTGIKTSLWEPCIHVPATLYDKDLWFPLEPRTSLVAKVRPHSLCDEDLLSIRAHYVAVASVAHNDHHTHVARILILRGKDSTMLIEQFHLRFRLYFFVCIIYVCNIEVTLAES
jgi:hypothetical protein